MPQTCAQEEAAGPHRGAPPDTPVLGRSRSVSDSPSPCANLLSHLRGTRRRNSVGPHRRWATPPRVHARMVPSHRIPTASAEPRCGTTWASAPNPRRRATVRTPVGPGAGPMCFTLGRNASNQDPAGTVLRERAEAVRGHVLRPPPVRLRTVNESGILWRVAADHTADCADFPAIQLTNRTTVLRISQSRCCASNGTAHSRTVPGLGERSS